MPRPGDICLVRCLPQGRYWNHPELRMICTGSLFRLHTYTRLVHSNAFSTGFPRHASNRHTVLDSPFLFLRRKKTGLFTGNDLAQPRLGSGRFQNVAGRVGSTRFKISRVGSGRVGSKSCEYYILIIVPQDDGRHDRPEGCTTVFSNTTPQFGSSRPLPKTDLGKSKTATR